MIELKNISKTYYDNGKKVEALKNINLSFNPGEIVGIIGYSGAGKYTTQMYKSLRTTHYWRSYH